MCMPRPELISTVLGKDFEAVSISDQLRPEEFAQYKGCSKLIVNIALAIDCAVLCHPEPMDLCVSFYFSETRKECRLVLYTDATINIGVAWRWMKLKKK